jgi:hypothetical protein
MSFLNPLYLLAALAAVVPLIIHLLHRQKARIEVFPSLEFLRKLMRRKTRRFHLKQILLLLVRILLLAFIAVALARPTLTGGRVVKGHLPTTAVVVLDDSFSMLRTERGLQIFDLARARAGELLDYFGRDDDVHLLTASKPSRNLSAGGATDPQSLRDVLGEMKCTNRTTDVASPLRQAISILEGSSKPNREIYIVSDMQRSGWEGLGEVVDAGKQDIKVLLVDIGGEDTNACVEDIAFRIPAGTDDLEMEVGFRHFNPEGSQGRVAEVFLKDALFDRAVFSPAASALERETFRIPPVEGFLWGEVAMAEDRLPLDDKRYFAIPSRKRVVGVVGDVYYIQTALSPKGGGGFQIVVLEEGGISPVVLARLDVLVLSNVPRLSPLEVDAVSDFLMAGGSLLIFLGGRVDIGAYNRSILPGIGNLRIEGSSPPGGAGFYTIERFERGHRIFAKFKPDASPFSEARFYQFIRVRPEGGRVIASFSDGSPAIVGAGEKVMVIASPPDVLWNDFVLTSQFLPVLHEILLYLTSTARLSRSYDVGDEILLPVSRVEGEVVLHGPAGPVRHFPEGAGRGLGFPIQSPDDPGIYFLRSEKETLSVFAINVDTSESDLTKIGIDQVKSWLRNFDVSKTSPADDMAESVATLRRGRDLARSFLWAGLLLIIFESLLASNLWQRLRPDSDEDTFTHS